MAGLQFSRNTKVYIKQGATNIWEVPVLDGYSFSQGTNTSEIALSEMESTTGVSRRGRTMFNDSLAPAEWSFDAYVRPNSGANTTSLAVEECLWANFVAANAYTPATGVWTAGVTKPANTNTVAFDFDDSNKSTLGTFNIYFVLGACDVPDGVYTAASGLTTVYKIEECVANSASVDFEIDGIAMVSWSGFGKKITEVGDFNSTTGGISTGVSSTTNFIRNRLTSLTVTAANTTAFAGAGGGVYNVTLTGGNITLENGITYLTPETLCTVNEPIGHVTGGRNISGSFSCYLTSAAGGSEDLFESMMTGGLSEVQNSFALSFSIGGSNNPKVVFSMPTCHLEVPTHSIDDVISVETSFHALPNTIGGTNEVVVTYTGA